MPLRTIKMYKLDLYDSENTDGIYKMPNGYLHNENDSKKGFSNLTTQEKNMVERVLKIWNNKNR